jgi:hypothetical protein
MGRTTPDAKLLTREQIENFRAWSCKITDIELLCAMAVA